MTDEIEIKAWVRRGDMLVNAYALEITDPDHPYNQIIEQGKRPENYGVKHPYAEELGELSREQLIDVIVNLRKEVESYAKGEAAGYPGMKFSYR